ncbi:NADH-quinone oxidoreductase subunit C [Olivibacter sp. XZL3]|uniref:NADH-quinone oxidoreductase subunit C n=1 Tax=Olivibacter sp. XZL3 TaxID=1735116 RepID=UPI001065A6F8|nr:NADH-quinone oxidoreductase subunit C [Olivibacter sp. XZL3]
MDLTKIKNILTKRFGDTCIVDEELQGLQPALIVHADFLLDICKELRQNKETWFDFLSCISAIDYGPNEGFGVVYHLASIPHKTQLTLKVKLDDLRDESILPSIDSVSSVWRTADWHEREAYDLVGVFFNGHPDLRRILLPDDWKGYPLRRDYQDAESYHGIPIN